MPSHLKIRARLLLTAATAALIVVAMPGSLALAGVSGAQARPGRSSTGLRPLAVTASDWTTFDHDSLGSGVDPSGNSFSPATPAWNSPTLDGQLYGQQLVFAGTVFAATENDTVYALAANTGAILWSTNVGTAVPSGDLPCGDIAPTVGITGTPVIDTARREIFAVADELVNGSIAHHLVGLNLYTGALELNQPVDPPGSTPADQLQRTGLNLDGGNVVFGFGGNEGSCSPYSGYVVSVPETGGTPAFYDTTTATPNAKWGAVWMGGGAPEIDAQRNIWIGTGNSTSIGPYDGGDSVVELSPQLAQEQLFAPTDWLTQNQGDQDLGSSPPALVGNGTIFQAGKSHTGYLLNRADLGGVGGQITSASVCTNADVDGGHAVIGTVVYIPCRSGIEAIQTSPSIGVLWQAPDGIGTPPISAGGLIWSIGNGNLYTLDPANGTEVQHFAIGPSVSSFPSPSAADGLILAPSSTQIHAFEGPAGLPPPTTSVLIPATGATLSGTATLDASASNATSVEFRLFGGSYGYSAPVLCKATPTLYGWLCSWNSTTVPNGSYALLSEAFNASGGAFSPGVSITVENAPTTRVLIPSSGATLSGTATLDASASNATSVEFRLFGGTYGFAAPVLCTATPTLYGWLCSWNSTTVPNGSYSLLSEAFNSGRSAFSSGVSVVTVKN